MPNKGSFSLGSHRFRLGKQWPNLENRPTLNKNNNQQLSTAAVRDHSDRGSGRDMLERPVGIQGRERGHSRHRSARILCFFDLVCRAMIRWLLTFVDNLRAAAAACSEAGAISRRAVPVRHIHIVKDGNSVALAGLDLGVQDEMRRMFLVARLQASGLHAFSIICVSMASKFRGCRVCLLVMDHRTKVSG